MHIKLAEYCYCLNNKNYDDAITVIDDNYDIILNNLHGTHKMINIKQYKILLDLLKYNAILIKNFKTDTTLDNYIDLSKVNMSVFEYDEHINKLFYLSLCLYLYDKDKSFDYDNNDILMIRHVDFLKFIINKYIGNVYIKNKFKEWVDEYKNQPDIVYNTIIDNITSLISECLIWSPLTQY